MKKIVKALRAIVALALIYLGLKMIFSDYQNDLIILVIGLNAFLDAVERYFGEDKNWFVIAFDIIMAIMMLVIYSSK